MKAETETETKIAELLAVLKMTETEQQEWVTKWLDENEPQLLPVWNRCEFSLADLSYRLRGEAEEESLVTGMMIVFRHATGACGGYDGVFPHMCEWFAIKANAMHVIIAALIAKLRKTK